MQESGFYKVSDQIKCLKNYVAKRTHCPKSVVRVIYNSIARFGTDFKKRWNKCSRTKARFLQENRDWLKGSLKFYMYCEKRENPGRPRLPFCELSERRKRESTQQIRTEHSPSKLAYAAQMELRSCGRVVASNVIKKVISSSPKSLKKLTAKTCTSPSDRPRQLSPAQALSVFVEAKLTRHQYNVIRAVDKEVFPSYKTIQKAKNMCYPDQSAIRVTETSAEISLQPLLDITSSRLMETQSEVLEQVSHTTFTLISKWGFDGSSGHSEYKQKFMCNDAIDSSVFLSCFVPLQLIANTGRGQYIVWQNPRPSSTRLCRPIRFKFMRETEESARAERDEIEGQINSLKPSNVCMNEKTFTVHHNLLFTMVDGKICNSLTGTKSTQRCYICGLTSRDLNDIDKALETPANESHFSFGLSVLHAWIRFLEFSLTLAARLPISKETGEEKKKKMEETKKEIQSKFKSQLGLIVNKPKQGFGNSNDGNTARRFFENVDVSAQITGIDRNILERFAIILKTLSSGYQINVGKFANYSLETAKLYVQKYPWNAMTPTVHKILIHGPAIIENALLPIGQLSEEAQEARNKEFKKCREFHARKSSRMKTNEDILNHLLITSDPMISSFRQISRKTGKLHPEVINMLESPKISDSPRNDDDEDDDEDDDYDEENYEDTE